ncbi:MAG: hypothetical protein AB7R55_02645 [Gemmatimonadales bacterium]
MALLGLLVGGCSDNSEPTPPNQGSRSYAMGFSGFPPRPDQAQAVRTLELWTGRADLAIVHEEFPWTDLLAGRSPDSLVRAQKQGLIDYFRGKGLALIFVADATDGLSRGEDPPQLRAAGRSMTEPAIQGLFRAWVRAFVDAFHPEYVALGAETNLVRLLAPPGLYQAAVAAANAAAADLAVAPNPPALFVTIQVEAAWGKFSTGSFIGVGQDLADFPFAELLGLSSYPYFVWATPAALPDDYYQRIVASSGLPVIVTEGGWPSESGPTFSSTPGRQAEYLGRQAELLDRVDALGIVQLQFTDIDLESFPEELREPARPFARLGLVDADLHPKPALAVWDSLFALDKER